MQCNCGGHTEGVHKVQRDKRVVGEYQRCPSCGRVLWLWRDDVLKTETVRVQSQTRAEWLEEYDAAKEL